MFRIKICGITNTDDALAAADAGADAIGLNFFSKSRRFVRPDQARQIASAVTSGLTKVGVFVNHSAAEIAEIAKAVQLDCIQLHGDEDPEVIALLPTNTRVIRAFRCGAQGLAPLAQYLDECRRAGRVPEAVLIDSDAGPDFGGTGRPGDWQLITHGRAALGELPLILAGGLTPKNVSAAMAVVRPDAVDVASGVESQPGIKDRDLIRQFVTAASKAFGSAQGS
jgi:phosphoribosylanthranilate isomerase